MSCAWSIILFHVELVCSLVVEYLMNWRSMSLTRAQGQLVTAQKEREVIISTNRLIRKKRVAKVRFTVCDSGYKYTCSF